MTAVGSAVEFSHDFVRRQTCNQCLHLRMGASRGAAVVPTRRSENKPQIPKSAPEAAAFGIATSAGNGSSLKQRDFAFGVQTTCVLDDLHLFARRASLLE
jgi:hypothetical protein